VHLHHALLSSLLLPAGTEVHPPSQALQEDREIKPTLARAKMADMMDKSLDDIIKARVKTPKPARGGKVGGGRGAGRPKAVPITSAGGRGARGTALGVRGGRGGRGANMRAAPRAIAKPMRAVAVPQRQVGLPLCCTT
jgi:hypothetical protein